MKSRAERIRLGPATAANKPRRPSLGKRFRRLPAVVRTKAFLRRLAGRDPWLRVEDPRATLVLGGWRVVPEGLEPGGIAYCAGVGENLAFELALADRGLDVHAFDPTPGTRTWVGDRGPLPLSFHPWALAGRDGPLPLYARGGRDPSTAGTMLSVVPNAGAPVIEVPGLRVDTIRAQLGHGRLALLKMDIEGAEYAVLDDLLAGDCRPVQLLIEFHHRFPGIGAAETARVVAALREHGYRLAGLSPEGREATFIRTASPAAARAGVRSGQGDPA